MGLTYNYLNLPVTANKIGTALSYIYDAAGQKLAKTATVNGITTNRKYIGGIEYNGNTIDLIHTEEGVAQNIGGTYTYHYNLSDHLGNVRYTFDIYNGAVRKLQSDDYYAFGKRRSVAPVSLDNKYLYNGKEMQDELASAGEDGQLDYGARFYGPVVGRWNVIDNKAEKYSNFTPYAYAINNPLKYIDPDGNEIIGVTKQDAQNFKADIYKVLADDKFSSVRALIDVKGKKFNHVDGTALSKSLDGINLSTDERAYIDMVTNTINSKDIQKVEYLSYSDDASSEGSDAMKSYLNGVQS